MYSKSSIPETGLGRGARRKKRAFDVLFSVSGLFILWPVILAAWMLARCDTGASGFFIQRRIGQNAQPFKVIKLRTMRPEGGSSVTLANDARITPFGKKLRRWKLDELPQLWNVLRGDMSFVGPRPDVPGFLDMLEENDRALLQLQPGITGPATLKYRNEEELLASVADPEHYNATVIWPDKVRINLKYMQNWSLSQDIDIIWKTLIK